MADEITQAELLFGAAALLEGEADSAVAVAEPPAVVYVPGPRSALVPADCAIDFPDVDANGGQLLRVLGPPRFRLWSAEYSVREDPRPCVFCNEEIGDQRCLAILSDRTWRWAHPLCAVAANGGQSMMNPRKRVKRDCARCTLPFDDHELSSLYGAVCQDGEHYVELPEEIAA